MRITLAKLWIGVALTACSMFGADVRLGTWKLNVAKSKFVSGTAIKSQTDVREATPDGMVKITRTGMYADGTAFSYNFKMKYDGKDYPVKGAPFDIIAVKRVDANTTSFDASQSKGKYHVKGTTEVSRDAQVLTQTSKGTDANGKPIDTILVFNRQ